MSMAKTDLPDDQTKELFALLGISDPAKREEFQRMAAAGPLAIKPSGFGIFKLDSITAQSADYEEQDAELA